MISGIGGRTWTRGIAVVDGEACNHAHGLCSGSRDLGCALGVCWEAMLTRKENSRRGIGCDPDIAAVIVGSVSHGPGNLGVFSSGHPSILTLPVGAPSMNVADGLELPRYMAAPVKRARGVSEAKDYELVLDVVHVCYRRFEVIIWCLIDQDGRLERWHMFR